MVHTAVTQPQKVKNEHLPLWCLALAGGLSSCFAEIWTFPFDTIKVRLQLRPDEYRGTRDCIKRTFYNEGPLAFYQGISAAFLRQSTFASIRIGIYDYTMQMIESHRPNKKVTFPERVLVGVLSGAFAIIFANPFVVLKVRFQNDTRVGGVSRYKNLRQATAEIIRTEVFLKFYQSLVPNMMRNSVIGATELTSYHQMKNFMIDNNYMPDGTPLHFLASSFAGLMATIFGSPFDIIKSHIMDGKVVGGVKVPYDSIWEATTSLIRTKGFLGLYAGFYMQFTRLVSWNIVMLMTRERLLKIFRKFEGNK